MSGLDLVIIILQGVSLLVLARVILSWIPLFTQRPLDYRNPLVKLLVDVTEPILAPLGLARSEPFSENGGHQTIQSAPQSK